jgi:type II secretory pathway pseudopilin PulG
LVVIAIIGLLSSIILASLNSARNKGQDSKVQSQLVNIRNAAGLAYDNSNGYGLATTDHDCAGMISNTSFGNLMASSSWPNATAPTCYSDATAGNKIAAYSMWHKMTIGGWCVDSMGGSVSKSTNPNSSNCGGGGSCTGPIGQACNNTTAIYAGSNYMTTPTDITITNWANAVSICSNLNYGGYSSGWYLPSLSELDSVLYANRVALGGFTPVFYWSSTEVTTGTIAWGENFSNGYQNQYVPEGSSGYARCVRTF